MIEGDALVSSGNGLRQNYCVVADLIMSCTHAVEVSITAPDCA
jgi:hypothetical protein